MSYGLLTRNSANSLVLSTDRPSIRFSDLITATPKANSSFTGSSLSGYSDDSTNIFSGISTHYADIPIDGYPVVANVVINITYPAGSNQSVLTRPSGSWATDGFMVNDHITSVNGGILATSLYEYTILSISGNIMVIDGVIFDAVNNINVLYTTDSIVSNEDINPTVFLVLPNADGSGNGICQVGSKKISESPLSAGVVQKVYRVYFISSEGTAGVVQFRYLHYYTQNSTHIGSQIALFDANSKLMWCNKYPLATFDNLSGDTSLVSDTPYAINSYTVSQGANHQIMMNTLYTPTMLNAGVSSPESGMLGYTDFLPYANLQSDLWGFIHSFPVYSKGNNCVYINPITIRYHRADNTSSPGLPYGSLTGNPYTLGLVAFLKIGGPLQTAYGAVSSTSGLVGSQPPVIQTVGNTIHRSIMYTNIL